MNLENIPKFYSIPTYPHLWKKIHSLWIVRNEAVESIRKMRNGLLLMKLLPWTATGDSYFQQLCQCTFHLAHTFFQHLCLALMSSWGLCGLVPGWAGFVTAEG